MDDRLNAFTINYLNVISQVPLCFWGFSPPTFRTHPCSIHWLRTKQRPNDQYSVIVTNIKQPPKQMVSYNFVDKWNILLTSLMGTSFSLGIWPFLATSLIWLCANPSEILPRGKRENVSFDSLINIEKRKKKLQRCIPVMLSRESSGAVLYILIPNSNTTETVIATSR